MQIAIDGPAGAGKSTIAKKVARLLGFLYIDSGALYRAVALSALEKQIDPQDEAALARLLQGLQLDLSEDAKGNQVVQVNGRDVSRAIRDNKVSQVVSAYSAVPAVRQLVTAHIQALAASRDVVMDGRDIGSVVLPQADVKVFLTASVAERARRRLLQLQAQGEVVGRETLEAEIAARDQKDRERAVAPLVQAPDALYLDSSNMDIDEVCQHILALIRK